MFLDEAVRASLAEARERMSVRPAPVLEEAVSLAPAPPPFRKAVARDGGGIRVIAEIKRMSPSAGEIARDADVRARVAAYGRGGACAVSVITCGYRFGGSILDLATAADATDLPVLRKDFITDEYQVLEARAFGASAVLLIAAAMGAERLKALDRAARDLGLDTLVEVHSEEDLEKAAGAGADLIGINNRDLSTLEVDLGTTPRLMPLVPAGAPVVSESGISERVHVRALERDGVDAVLIGEALMRAEDPEAKLRELLGEVSGPCG